jgi:hypothetical protein
MNTISIVVIVVAVLGLAAVGVVSFLNSKKKNKKADEVRHGVNFPELKPDEKAVVDLVNDFMGETANPPPVYVVRNEEDHIPHLEMNWKQFHINHPAVGMYWGEVVYVSRDTDYPDLLHFGMTYVHELMHRHGHNHGDDMYQEEVRLHGILGHRMDELKLDKSAV